jgi:hypothetical protein
MLSQALVSRHEEMPNGILTAGRQLEAELRALSLEEGMRDLDEDARPIAGERVGPDGSAMLEILKNAQGVDDDLVARPRLEVGDEADAAGIVLTPRIKQATRLIVFVKMGAE